MDELAAGLWRWTARHPEWHPGRWGAEVASFAVRADDVTLLVDPLVDSVDELDGVVAGPVAILITIPYHTRSAEALADRYDGTIHGHPAVAKRLSATARFHPISPDEPLPGAARAFTIGKPRRYEMPIYLPSHRAVAFGDALVTTLAGDLRIWHWREPVDPGRARWYRERFVPTLQPLLELNPDHILPTHGPPILHDGTAALAAALDAEPWHNAG